MARQSQKKLRENEIGRLRHLLEVRERMLADRNGEIQLLKAKEQSAVLLLSYMALASAETAREAGETGVVRIRVPKARLARLLGAYTVGWEADELAYILTVEERGKSDA